MKTLYCTAGSSNLCKDTIIALRAFLLLLALGSPSYADGFTSGPTYSRDGTVIGTHVSLSVDGQTVYTRSYGRNTNPQGSKDARFTETLFIDGLIILNLEHFRGDVRSYLSGADKHDITIDFSGKHSAIREIRVTPKKDRRKEYVWKADAEGFLTEFRARSFRFGSPRF